MGCGEEKGFFPILQPTPENIAVSLDFSLLCVSPYCKAPAISKQEGWRFGGDVKKIVNFSYG